MNWLLIISEFVLPRTVRSVSIVAAAPATAAASTSVCGSLISLVDKDFNFEPQIERSFSLRPSRESWEAPCSQIWGLSAQFIRAFWFVRFLR